MNKLHRAKKFLVLSFIFTLYILHFTLYCYALNLEKVKIPFLVGDYKSAISEGERAMADLEYHTSGADELYYILGLCYLKEGNYLRASDIFEIILKEFKNSRFKEEAMFGLADAYLLQQDYKSAQTYYKNLESNKHSKLLPLVYYRLSQCFAKIGDIQTTKMYQDKLHQEFPLSLEIYSKIELSSGTDFYSIQVGAFSNSNNAYRLSRKLNAEGYDAYVEEVDLQGRTLYRVKVGRLYYYPQAQELQDKLSRQGYPTKICP